MQRAPHEQKHTLELITSNGIIALTILGYPNVRGVPPAALVCGYLTDNPIAPTITCTASEARRLAEKIIAAADDAERVVAELAANASNKGA